MVSTQVVYAISSFFVFAIVLVIMFTFRKKLQLLYNKYKKDSVRPDKYSYLSRAISYNNLIGADDIVATIIDLNERGYIELEQIAGEVGINEFIDYSIEVISREIEDSSEKALLESFKDFEPSLHNYVVNIYPEFKEIITNLAKETVDNVTIVKTNEALPKLIGFRIIKK